MSVLFALVWAAGGIPVAILSEVVKAESPRAARAGRIAFALLLAGDLLLAALFFTIGNSSATVHMTRGIWWVTVVLGGIPLALVSGWAVRRGYAGTHRLVLAAASLLTAVLYLAFPLGYTAIAFAPTGLGRFEHTNHALDVVILLIPTLILLADELRRRGEEAPAVGPAGDGAGFGSGLAGGRGRIVVAVLLLVALIWTAGTNSYGMLIGFAVVLAAFGAWVWQRNRAEVRAVMRDLHSPPGTKT
jgi:hypothetical protein